MINPKIPAATWELMGGSSLALLGARNPTALNQTTLTFQLSRVRARGGANRVDVELAGYGRYALRLWRVHSKVGDGSSYTVDLVGAYHDLLSEQVRDAFLREINVTPMRRAS